MFDELAHSVDKIILFIDRCQVFVDERAMFVDEETGLQAPLLPGFIGIDVSF